MKIFKKVQWGKHKKIKKKTDLLVASLLMLGILAAVNFLSYQFFYRFDLTKGHVYSISKPTHKTLESLDDIVSIKLYFSKDLPSEFLGVVTEVKDILDEYENYSQGKIKVEKISLGDEPEKEKEAQKAGVPKIRFNVIRQDKFETLGGYLGMVIYYEDKKEVIPFIKNSRNLEYEITSAIKKLTLKDIPVVAFAMGNDETPLEKLKAVSEELKKQYKLEIVDLSQGDFVNEKINTLIIAGAKTAFSERSKYVIDQFLMRGGNLIVAEDSFLVEENLLPIPNEGSLSDLLEFYGVKINKDLVLDGASNEVVGFSGGAFPININYPFWPKILKENFNQENPVTANLETAVFPWVSSLSLLPQKNVKNQVTELVKTSPKSWTVEGAINLDPFQRFSPEKFGQYTLAVSLLGKFDSFYKDKERPSRKTTEEKNSVDSQEDFIDSVSSAHIVVIGDSDFIKDEFLFRNFNNLVFFQNIIDSMSLGEDLINIRSKGELSSPLKNIGEGTKRTLKYLNIFGPVVVIIILGIIKFYWRRKTSNLKLS